MLKCRMRFGDAELEVGDTKLDYEPLDDQFFKLVQAFVRDTHQHVPWHQKRLDGAGIPSGQIANWADFEAIQPMGGHDLGSLPELALIPRRYTELIARGLTDLPDDEKFAKRFTTTGSTGKPKIMMYTRADWDSTLAANMRMMSHVRWEDFNRVFNCFNAGHTGGKLFEDSFSRFGCVVENRHFSLKTPEEVVDQMVDGMSALGGFNCIIIPPGKPPGTGTSKGINLDELLNADSKNFIGQNIKTIVTTGFARLPEFRLMERVWEANEIAGVAKTRFVEMYGSSEVVPLAFECEHYEGQHVSPGHCYVEVIDERTRRHVKNGERGLVSITGFKHGTRFLRYLVGDEATFVSDPCKCGRATARLKEVVRVMDMDRIRQGCAAG